jgi:soluble lytic murein transglycosylase-like protein
MKHNQRFAQQVTGVAGKAMVILSAAVAFLVPSTVTDILIEQKVILPRQVQVIAEALAEGAADASHTTSTAELERAVTRAAQQHHVHPALLFAVMKAESSFNPLVVSKAGAVGLMQLVPETAMRHGVRNLYDMTENVAGGAKHLRYSWTDSTATRAWRWRLTMQASERWIVIDRFLRIRKRAITCRKF